MSSPIPNQSTPLIALLSPLRKRRRDTPIKLRHIHIIQETRIPQSSLDQLRVLNKQILARATHTGILATQRRHKHRRLAIVVELVVDGTLGADGTLVETDGREDGLVKAVFQDEAGV